MSKNLPYVTSATTLETMLQNIQAAAVPERFTQDFVANVLGMKGGTAKAVIPFIKKMAFVSSDGTPTDLYKAFRNKSRSGAAIAESMKRLYPEIFSKNEKAHELSEDKIRGILVELTGSEEGSSVVKQTLGTFRVLNRMADFTDKGAIEPPKEPPVAKEDPIGRSLELNRKAAGSAGEEGINLSYTINLNLPATTDVNVYNAIFKSLKEYLIKR